MASTASTPLFRREALEHAGVKRYGVVMLARPASYAFLALFFTAVAVCVLAFFAFFSYTRKVQLSGVVRPAMGVIRLASPQSGVVARRLVHEGQSVQAGDALFVLRGERSSMVDADAQARLSALIQQRRASLAQEQHQVRLQSTQKADQLRQRCTQLREESARIGEQMALQRRRVALAQEAQTRYKDLQAAHFISAAEAQTHLAELLDQQQRLADLERAQAGAQRELSTALSELQDLPIKTQRDEAAVARDTAAIEQDLVESEVRREFVVRATQSGVVSAITADVGQGIAAGQTMASVLPQGSELEIELYAPSRSIGFIREGMDVSVRFQAFPSTKFGASHARVFEVASSVLRPDEVAAGATQAEPLYRVRARLERQTVKAFGVDQRLLAGMLLDTSISLETRRIYEWVLEPLYAVTGQL